jgi:hypothetical protein
MPQDRWCKTVGLKCRGWKAGTHSALSLLAVLFFVILPPFAFFPPVLLLLIAFVASACSYYNDASIESIFNSTHVLWHVQSS